MYHIGLVQPLDDVRYVCLGGKRSRMERFAQRCADALGLPAPVTIGSNERYSIYKVGHVLVVVRGHATRLPRVAPQPQARTRSDATPGVRACTTLPHARARVRLMRSGEARTGGGAPPLW